MSRTQRSARSIGTVQARGRDPLAAIDDKTVLRCDDPETGWRWFYDRRPDGLIERYHEYHDFAREVIPHDRAAETAGFGRVDVVPVSRTHLEILAEGGDE